ncbi:hypothetical protein PMO01_00740 [Pseudomonas moraviensis R28-S]|uniref:Uncharacterized protein n=1 Tax=Pseudomonas moraviensis R28-S TaxID=1395516 RepID=V8RFB9_9PSED|nr:hypothetical protein PMO01_00740 [Pseudomonas moraviensis R28-S]
MLRRVDQVLGTLPFQIGRCLFSFDHRHVNRNFPVPVFIFDSEVGWKVSLEIGGPSSQCT